MNNVFIAGINSGCGKTVISAGIAAVMQSLGYKTGVYKPIQTGAINKEKYLISPDLAFVKMLDPYITTHSTYMFAEKTLPAITTNSIEMQDISKDFPFVRVDFYSVNQKIYVGELTFYPWSGCVQFSPDSFDFELGSYFKLPPVTKKK